MDIRNRTEKAASRGTRIPDADLFLSGQGGKFMKTLPMIHNAQLFINGEFINATSGNTLDIINPATGGVIGQLADAGKEDVDRAVMAGQRAFDEAKWSGASPQERARVLNRFADFFEADLAAFFDIGDIYSE